jgi:diaminopimelate epimerase
MASMSIPFVKMHGLGNDFVVIDDVGKPAALCHKVTPELARAMLDRRWGIGGDQLLWLKSPEGSSAANAAHGASAAHAPFARMEIFNPDGSRAEMCGNGIRAAALYLYRHGPKRQPEYAIETLGGLKLAEIRGALIRVDMGEPRFGSGSELGETIEVDGQRLVFHAVDMGNPHAVVFVDPPGGAARDTRSAGGAPLKLDDIERLGPLLERHSRFPDRTNVEFVEILGAREIRVRVWERGAGLTLACGTGACASAVVALRQGRVQGRTEVRLPGGSLWIEWSGAPNEPVYMEGPAEEVFRGQFMV